MTPEQRLDRLERIAKLFVKAGLRARHEGRHQDDKMNVLINLQIRNDEKFTQHEEKLAKQDEKFADQNQKLNILIDFQIRNEERLIVLQSQNEERFANLAESQVSTDRRLDALIDIIREGRNGDSSSEH